MRDGRCDAGARTTAGDADGSSEPLPSSISMSAGPVEMLNDGVLPPAHIQTTEGISVPTLTNDT